MDPLPVVEVEIKGSDIVEDGSQDATESDLGSVPTETVLCNVELDIALRDDGAFNAFVACLA